MLFRALIPTTVPNFKTTPFFFPIFPSLPGLYARAIGDIFLLMDYNPLHRDRLVKNWILEQSIERMKCPECLCNMHPTYHAWDTLGRRVSDWPRSVMTTGELETALVKKRMKLGHNLVNHHVNSMPSQYSAVSVVREDQCSTDIS
ncbi:hypothetical protein AVEN_26676-1 [Araneus ventricosus]|uniref:Tc1-like transposase DDE domain-containing protein n=1 Tax=Araneus ventricosus TaxID=182803 RepID=A0A4Y2MYW3_ARAVE|nr:hypothetical protein AVEN_26676-1 [Araneus ventricosus]